jgi:glycosyltransferase involved in cell wall biosynthesis
MAVKVCYINHFGYKLFNSDYFHPYAGAQTAMFEEAVELAKDSAFEVHMLVEADEEKCFKKGKIDVWTMKWKPQLSYVNFKSRPGSLFAYHLSLWRKLKEINADVYIQRATLGETRLVTALFCKKYGKKYVYVIPGTPARMLPLWKPISFLRWIICDRASMQLADKLVAISRDQFKYTPPRTHSKTTVIYIGKKLPLKKSLKREFFLFIGRNTSVKQPDLFVKLAEHFPDERFVLICPYEKPVPKNVKVLGFVPYKKIGYYFSRAIALISLTTEEGFGNVHVEAWQHGTPVIALTTDVDELVCRHKLGYHSRNWEQLLKDVKNIRASWTRLSRNCTEYFKQNHSISEQVKKYKEILE